jgi:hypothetical protein
MSQIGSFARNYAPQVYQNPGVTRTLNAPGLSRPA